MDDKLQLLLDKIGLETNEFQGGKLEKIICNQNKNKYNFLITLKKPLPLNIYIKFTKTYQTMQKTVCTFCSLNNYLYLNA